MKPRGKRKRKWLQTTMSKLLIWI